MGNICGRAIMFDKDNVILLFRHVVKEGKTKEYYAIPGGHQEDNETIEECVIREIKEEYGVDIEIKAFLGKEEDMGRISHFFYVKILSGTPKLGGEELEKNNPNNYYEIQYININELDKYDILEANKEIIRKAYAMKEDK